jgi:flagellar protein FlaI
MEIPRLVLRPRVIGSECKIRSLVKGMARTVSEQSAIHPHFSDCWINPSVPTGAELVEEYPLSNACVRILSLPGGVRAIYHLTPWEYNLPRELTSLLWRTIETLAHRPPPDLGISYDDLREYVLRVSPSLLTEISDATQIRLGSSAEETTKNVKQLSDIVARYTVGLGIFELLLSDDRVEDIYVDAPCHENPIHVTVNGVAGLNTVFKCSTNITASEREIEGLTSRLRQYSRKPFSEVFPTMETDVQGFDARATVIGPPLSPMGTAVALRHHARTPWTLPKLANNGTITAFAAGLISFLIDGRSTIIICGPRGAGKSAMLSAALFEFPLSQRILTIEDTMELPVRQMQRLGYKVQSMMVEQALGEEREEKTDEALRVSLRMGESAIVLGEVRGKEAQTLYQSMRTGKAGSSVLGTIHGDSAQSVYERVVHDIGIPKEAFAATDIVITMALNRPRGSQRQVRKLVEVVEYAKDRGPGEFNVLLQYDFAKGRLSPLSNARSETIQRIAESWNMTYQEAVENIQTRASMREALVEAARAKGAEYLGPEWVCRSNESFRQQMDRGNRDYGEIVKAFRDRLFGREEPDGTV